MLTHVNTCQHMLITVNTFKTCLHMLTRISTC